MKQDQVSNIHCRTHAGIKTCVPKCIKACMPSLCAYVCVCVPGWYACVHVLQLSPGIRGPCLPRYNKHSVSLCPACPCTMQGDAGECQTWAALALLIYRFKSPACWGCPPTGTGSRTHSRAGWMDIQSGGTQPSIQP